MRHFLVIISLLGCACVLSGCENTLEPLSADREDTIALYGILDMRSNQQVIRLEALRASILANDDELDGIRVRSIAIGSGTFQEWRDSLATDDAGNPITLFVSDFTPEAGTSYRLTVSRDQQLLAEAVTKVPAAPGLLLDPVTGDESSLSQTVYLRDMNGAPESVTISYSVIDIGASVPTTVDVSYGRIAEAPVTQLSFDVTYWSDRFVVVNALGRDIDEAGIKLTQIELSFDLPSPAWADAQSSNLLGGLGFFASVGRYSYTWPLDQQSVETMGWIDAQ